MYARFRTQKIPSGIKVLKPEQLNDIWIKKFDMSSYEKIVFVGDVHGSYTALMEYFKNGFNDNYFYIFVGDIIDRGIENAETVKFFIDAVQKKNVLVLEGNHERWLYTYSHDETGKSKDTFRLRFNDLVNSKEIIFHKKSFTVYLNKDKL